MFVQIGFEKFRWRSAGSQMWSALQELYVFGSQCMHELRVHIGRRLNDRHGAQLFSDGLVASKRPPTIRTMLQMVIKFAGICYVVLEFAICGDHRLRLVTIHSSLTSCLYKPINRSRARISRIFTAEALMFNTCAISAQESPSFSYSHKHTAYLGGSF